MRCFGGGSRLSHIPPAVAAIGGCWWRHHALPCDSDDHTSHPGHAEALPHSSPVAPPVPAQHQHDDGPIHRVLCRCPLTLLLALGLVQATETTYVMIKPDGVQRGLISPILDRFLSKVPRAPLRVLLPLPSAPAVVLALSEAQAGTQRPCLASAPHLNLHSRSRNLPSRSCLLPPACLMPRATPCGASSSSTCPGT